MTFLAPASTVLGAPPAGLILGSGGILLHRHPESCGGATTARGSHWSKPSESLTIELDPGPSTGAVEEIGMKRKSAVAKKRPEEVRVNQIVDLIDPSRRPAEPSGTDPGPEAEPEPESTEDLLGGVNQHLAKALEVATAECARLADQGAALAKELDDANARVRELEGVLKHIDGFVSSALPKAGDPTEGRGEST